MLRCAAGAAAAAGEEPFRDLVGKTWERLLQCALTELSRWARRWTGVGGRSRCNGRMHFSGCASLHVRSFGSGMCLHMPVVPAQSLPFPSPPPQLDSLQPPPHSCRTPLRFAKFVPAWVTLCINTALLGMDASTIHHVRCMLCAMRTPAHCCRRGSAVFALAGLSIIRPPQVLRPLPTPQFFGRPAACCAALYCRAKSRVLLTRFVAQVLLSPYYRPDAFQGSPAACK